MFMCGKFRRLSAVTKTFFCKASPARAARIMEEPAVVAFCPTFTWKAFRDTSKAKLPLRVASLEGTWQFRHFFQAAKTNRNMVKIVVTFMTTLDRILGSCRQVCRQLSGLLWTPLLTIRSRKKRLKAQPFPGEHLMPQEAHVLEDRLLKATTKALMFWE